MASLLRRSLPLYRTHICKLSAAFYSTTTTVNERIASLVKDDKVVVFMKGTPQSPRCGFSNAVSQILNFHGVDKYSAHDVLEDDALRQGIKDFSSWPTIPQVYINGEFVGGCDIMLELHKNGELIEILNNAGIKSALVDNTNDNVKGD